MSKTKYAKNLHKHLNQAAAKSSDTIVVRRCSGLSEFASCIEIERTVWRSADIDVVPLPLFVIAAETGGQVLGAFDGDRMIGFAISIAGLREGRPFLHSHMAAVLEPYRGAGVGKKMKLFQRDDARSRGMDLVEWTFDPLEVRNAHFNFGLGAIVRRFLPNFYGLTTSPLHGGLPTDRLVAEWWLDSPRVRRSVAGGRAGKAASRPLGKRVARIHVSPEMAILKRSLPDEAARLQAEVRQEFEHWLGLGYAATAIEIKDGGGTYLLEPRAADRPR